MIRIAGFLIALLPAILATPAAAGPTGPGLAAEGGVPGQDRVRVATVAPGAQPPGRAQARTGARTNLCVAVRRQVMAWSRREGRRRDRPHVVAIMRPTVVVNRMRRSPVNGVLLRCAGRARVSNGLTAHVTFGIRAIDGNWYLFLRKAVPSATAMRRG